MPSEDWNPDDCTSWCDTASAHNHDPACWGQDSVGHEVLLSMEEGFPREAVEPYDMAWIRKHDNAPYVGVYAYRERPGHREVVYLYLNRESDNEFRCLDSEVHLTGQEAVQLANHLLNVAVVVDPSLADVMIKADSLIKDLQADLTEARENLHDAALVYDTVRASCEERIR